MRPLRKSEDHRLKGESERVPDFNLPVFLFCVAICDDDAGDVKGRGRRQETLQWRHVERIERDWNEKGFACRALISAMLLKQSIENEKEGYHARCAKATNDAQTDVV